MTVQEAFDAFVAQQRVSLPGINGAPPHVGIIDELYRSIFAPTIYKVRVTGRMGLVQHGDVRDVTLIKYADEVPA